MRIFKTILKILMIVIFVFSVTFNCLIAGASYGTLIFKHSDSKMLTMVSVERLDFEQSYFSNQKNSGIQIYKVIKDETSTTKVTYKFYFDKESELTVYVLDEEGKETYYRNNLAYTSENNAPQLIDQSILVGSTLAEISVLQDVLISDIPTSKNKAKIDFSFSPFYFMGIKYSIKEENRTLTFRYDLNGDLRKIEIKNNDGSFRNYSIGYENQKISIPNSSK